jgi:hypothetical protein
MENGTLAEILGVEQEIRAQLDAEREQARRWLDGARSDVEREHQAGLARLQAEMLQRREAALHAAQEAASATVRRAEAAARADSGVCDADLRALLRRHLVRILPEAAR